MVEIYDPSGNEFFENFISEFPEMSYVVEAGQFSAEPYQTVHPRLLISSVHPTIKGPLVVQLGGYLPMYWHRGYFIDFVAESFAADAFDLLGKFFEEEILYGVRVRENTVLGGGPIIRAKVDICKKWLRNSEETLEVRSWLGTFDQDMNL